MRKKNRRVFTLSVGAEQILDGQDNQSKFVNDAIIEKAAMGLIEHKLSMIKIDLLTAQLQKMHDGVDLTDLNEEKI